MTSSSAGITCISRSKRSFAARTKIGWGTNLVALFHAQYDTLCALSRHRRRRTSLVLRSESSKDQHARGWGNLLPFTLIKQSSSCVCTGVYGDSWTGLETCSAVEELIEECPLALTGNDNAHHLDPESCAKMDSPFVHEIKSSGKDTVGSSGEVIADLSMKPEHALPDAVEQY